MATESYSFYDLKTLQFLSSIPLLNEPIVNADNILSNNPYLSLPYLLAKSASNTTIRSTDSLVQQFAPYILKADDLVNARLTQAAEKYPYPFEVHPDNIATLLRERSEAVQSLATKTVEQRVVNPAVAVVEQLDAGTAPIFDFLMKTPLLEPVLNASPDVPEDAKFMQFERVLALGKGLVNFTTQQFHDLQEQNLLLHNATVSVQSFLSLGQTSVDFANARVVDVRAQLDVLTSNLLAQLNLVQERTNEAIVSLQTRAQELPAAQPVLEVYKDSLATVERLREIALEDNTWGDKATKLREEMQEKLQPLLAQLRAILPMKA